MIHSIAATLGIGHVTDTVDRSAKAAGTKAERVARRRGQVLGAAAHLMQRSGYHSMSMQALADEADISVGLIYQYFGNKEDVLRAVIVDILEDFRDRVPAAVAQAGPDPIDRLSVALRSFCEIIDSKRDATVLSYRESLTLSREGRDQIKFLEIQTTEPIRQAVKDGIDGKLFRDVDPELIVHNVLMIAHGWALKHWRLAPMMSLERYVVAETSLLLASISVEPANELGAPDSSG